jgi:Carboxypeptidase regulatory-like domain/TonB dependent receptor/TonB-dependent Receptor Plug Domain
MSLSLRRPINLGTCLQTFLAVLLAFVISAPAVAQVVGATLSGRVSDPSGAVIPDAQVTISNVGTGITRIITTDAAGFYTAPNLSPGNYEVTCSAPGLATELHKGITLTVGAQQALDLSMHVASSTGKIEVTVEAPTVELASSTINAVIGATTVVELPLNGRSWTDLASLQMGVSPIETQVAFNDLGKGSRGFGAQISISGARPQQNNYRLDGISINDYANGGPGSVLGGNLGVDAIEEFSVLTSNYSAEYGKTSGGVVNAISRSGTNQFHGSAYWFLRDEGLDARNFFDLSTPTQRTPPFHRNQFGASGGGPIRKNRTFIFADYEGIRQAKGVSSLKIVPSLAARAGNLCSLCPAAQQVSVTPDPAILAYMPLYPMPSGPAFGTGDVAPFNFSASRVVTENYITTRIDHHFSDRDSLFGTYLYDDTPFTSDEPLGNVLVGSETKRQIVALEETHTFSPALVNTLRVGYNRARVDNTVPIKALTQAAGDTNLAAVPGDYAPWVQGVPGLTLNLGGLLGNGGTFFRWNAYQVDDDAFLTKGNHSLKFGFEFERDQNNTHSLGHLDGIFTFGTMQDFITNHPSKFQVNLSSADTPRDVRQSIVGAYLQDDWRFRPNLTLNLGLRYEMTTVPTEVKGELSNLENLTDPASHLGSPYFQNPTLRNFEPRVGFAWDPFRNGKTAVRGGFGMFDALPMQYLFSTMYNNAYPFVLIGFNGSPLPTGSFPAGALATVVNKLSSFQMISIDPKPKRNYVMQWNLNVQRELPSNVTATIGFIGSRGVHMPVRVDDANMVIPTLTSAGYLWPASTTPAERLNPNVAGIRYLNWAGGSEYDALQVGIVKRMSHGFQVQGSYTWGKSIDTNSASVAGDTWSNSISSLDYYDLRLTRAVSDFNISRTLVINGIWLLPSLKSGPLAWVASGWEFNSIFRANDGVPFTVLFGTGGDPTGSKRRDDFAYPDVVPGCNPINRAFKQSPEPLYINTDCFTLPMAPNMAFWQANCDTTSKIYGPNLSTEPSPVCFNLRGNAGRNIVNGPGLVNLDFSIIKNTHVNRVSENFNVQFRTEIFNILNRANFNLPDYGSGNADIFQANGVVNPSAGLLTSTTTDPREIQFALKLIW